MANKGNDDPLALIEDEGLSWDLGTEATETPLHGDEVMGKQARACVGVVS